MNRLQRSEEMSAGNARLRIDVHGSEPVEHAVRAATPQVLLDLVERVL